MSIETVGRLKTALCAYGDIWSAIRQSATDIPMQCTLGHTGAVRLEATLCGLAGTLRSFSVSHRTWIDGRRRDIREATGVASLR
jgi:hypothetical protein